MMILSANQYFEKGKPTGKFMFTVFDGINTYPIGYCKNGCVHKNEIEASDCYRRWCMEQNNSMCLDGNKANDDFGTNLEVKI